MQDFEPDVQRLTRYLSGAYSGAELAAFERWLAADPTRGQELEVLRRVWEASAGIPPSDRVDEMWRDLSRRIHESEPLAPTSSTPVISLPVLTLERRGSRRRMAWRWWGTGIAAAASLVVAVAYGVRDYGRRAQMRFGGSLPTELVQEYRTTRGQRTVIQLGDGTRVDLGVASILRVHPFSDRRRDVELVEGEAAFKVTHDPARPFAVRARNAVVQDLGTRFDVRAYREERQIRVVVAEGKVTFHADVTRPDTTAVLLPGDLGVMDSAGRAYVQHGVVPETYLAWTLGRLRFDNAPLADVAVELERWYSTKIAIATPALARRRVTLSIPVSSLTDVLDAVTAPLGLAHRWSGPATVLLYAE